MPPYWALGFMISRYGYENLDDMKRVYTGFKEFEIPLVNIYFYISTYQIHRSYHFICVSLQETQFADIDHYDEKYDFTIDPIKWKGLPEYFDELSKNGLRTVIILDPAIGIERADYWPYTTGRDHDVFIRWPSDKQNPDYNITNSSVMLGAVCASLLY